VFIFSSLSLPQSPLSTLFPYTTLFRSPLPRSGAKFSWIWRLIISAFFLVSCKFKFTDKFIKSILIIIALVLRSIFSFVLLSLNVQEFHSNDVFEYRSEERRVGKQSQHNR